MSTQGAPYGIGAVVTLLQGEFPDSDVTVSKIRFLETAGIVTPARTPSGYRKFSDRDVDRLRYTLRMQRDHFLPLRVIGKQLDQIDRGFAAPVGEQDEPQIPAENQTRQALTVPKLTDPVTSIRLTEQDLAEQTGLSKRQILDILRPAKAERATEDYPVAVLEFLSAVSACESFGIEYRHLKNPVVNAADRQLELVATLVAPQLQAAKSADDRADAYRRVEDLTEALLRLHVAAMQLFLQREFSDTRAGAQ